MFKILRRVRSKDWLRLTWATLLILAFYASLQLLTEKLALALAGAAVFGGWLFLQYPFLYLRQLIFRQRSRSEWSAYFHGFDSSQSPRAKASASRNKASATHRPRAATSLRGAKTELETPPVDAGARVGDEKLKDRSNHKPK